MQPNNAFHIAVLAGDGIGEEIMGSAIEVLEAARPLRRLKVLHVRREENREADALANLAIDRRDSGATGGGDRPPRPRKRR